MRPGEMSVKSAECRTETPPLQLDLVGNACLLSGASKAEAHF